MNSTLRSVIEQANRFSELLGLDPIESPEPIDIDLRMPSRRAFPPQPVVPASSFEDQLARQAVAAIEREDGFDGCAEHRLRGAYDGDAEHRIALKAIELFHQSQGAGYGNVPGINHE